MESAGILKIFRKSITTRKLRYLFYLDDDDSKAFLEVVKNNSYPGLTIKKQECVGHVQKRMGTRVRAIRVSFRKDSYRWRNNIRSKLSY